MWPNGHQDQLHHAASAWTQAAALFDRIADTSTQADTCIAAEHTPETPAALTAIHAMRAHLHELARTYRALANACTDYAHHLDQAHSAAISELESLLEWSAAIEAGGALLSIVTFGLAEAPTQAAETTRIAATAASITAIFERLQTFAAAASATIETATQSLELIAAQARLLLETRCVAAETEFVRDSAVLRGVRAAKVADHRLAFPDLKLTRAQIESHYYHSDALGVTLPRGKEGFIAMGQAAEAFVRSPETTHVLGTYRAQPAVLNFNLATGQVLVQRPDGTFWSVWKLRPTQLWWVLKKGSLGGG